MSYTNLFVPPTTASGIRVADNQNSLSAGPRGPLLLQDSHPIGKLQHFNRERIPERVVHAKGSGAPVEAAGTAPQGFCHGDAGWVLNGAAGRFDERGTSDDFTQAGNLFRLLSADERRKLCNNLAGPLRLVKAETLERQLGHFDRADPAYSAGVRAALG